MGLLGFRIAELSAVLARLSWCLLAVATIVNAQNASNPQACGQIGPAAAAFMAQNPRAGTSAEKGKTLDPNRILIDSI